jgi:hypothetical protein
MLAILAFLLALSGGAFASSFHGPGPDGGSRGITPVRFDGGTGLPDHGAPTPMPLAGGGGMKVGVPVRMDGGTGLPDRP